MDQKWKKMVTPESGMRMADLKLVGEESRRRGEIFEHGLGRTNALSRK